MGTDKTKPDETATTNSPARLHFVQPQPNGKKNGRNMCGRKMMNRSTPLPCHFLANHFLAISPCDDFGFRRLFLPCSSGPSVVPGLRKRHFNLVKNLRAERRNETLVVRITRIESGKQKYGHWEGLDSFGACLFRFVVFVRFVVPPTTVVPPLRRRDYGRRSDRTTANQSSPDFNGPLSRGC